MDINDFRGIMTAIIFIAFIGIWIWAWSSRRKKDFEESAQLPLEEGQRRDNNAEENT